MTGLQETANLIENIMHYGVLDHEISLGTRPEFFKAITTTGITVTLLCHGTSVIKLR